MARTGNKSGERAGKAVRTATAGEAAGPVRVQRIEVRGLFRQYDHRIDLRQEDRVTVLHGRNGVGKTVTLSLIAALLRGDYYWLIDAPFDEVRIEFTDGSYVSAQHGATGDGVKMSDGRFLSSDSGRRLAISYAVKGGKDHSFLTPTIGDIENLAREYFLKPFGRRRWIDLESGEQLTLDGVAARYDTSLLEKPGPKEVRALRERIPIHFIESQRLFKRVDPKSPVVPLPIPGLTSAVSDISEEMVARITETDSLYSSTSTRLDNSLPTRLFAPSVDARALSEEEISSRTESLEKERARLHSIGLLADTTAFNPSALNPTQRAMFAVYLADNEEKLRVFKDLADRAEILLKTINRKFAPKRFTIDKDDGYIAFSHDGQTLSLDALSSGEQHELVLLHSLLFRVEPGALLLIDEPELSLHVTWQSEFLEELIQIAKVVGFDAIVATHSPYIVGSRRDLMVQLGEPV